MTKMIRLMGTVKQATLTCLVISALAVAAQAADKADAVALSLDTGATLVLDADHNGFPAKTKMTPTASYAEYSLAPVIDGIKKRQGLGWQEAAWASEDEDSTHGIEIQFGKPMRGGRFQVTWAYDANGDENVRWWASRNYVIQVKDKASDPWKTVVEVKNNQSVVGCYPLPDAPFNFLRIYQPTDGGHPARPKIMWVGQLEILD